MKLIFAVTTCLLFSSKSWSTEGADLWKQKLFCENSCEETSYCKSKYMMVIHEARDSLGTERSILVIKKGHEGSEVSEESYGCSFKNHYLNCETDKMKISININDCTWGKRSFIYILRRNKKLAIHKRKYGEAIF